MIMKSTKNVMVVSFAFMKSIDYLLRFINVLSYRLPNFLMNPKSYPFQFSHTHTVFIIFMNELLFTFSKHEAYYYWMYIMVWNLRTLDANSLCTRKRIIVVCLENLRAFTSKPWWFLTSDNYYKNNNADAGT